MNFIHKHKSREASQQIKKDNLLPYKLELMKHSLGNIHIQIGEKGRGSTGKNTVIPND